MRGFSQGLIVGCILGCVMSATVLAIAQPIGRITPQSAVQSLRARPLSPSQVEGLRMAQTRGLVGRLRNGQIVPAASMQVLVVPPAPRCVNTRDCDNDGDEAIVYGGNDCDDNDPERRPSAMEVVDARGKDEDCDPTTIGMRDADGDGFVTSDAFNVSANGEVRGSDCNDNKINVNIMAQEVPNYIDDNCNTVIDDLDGWWAPHGGPYERN